ncbi:hypothetical protein ACJ72_00116 [Emergomyces africanus]|uniref:Uncharacterized protein n=1 Tax=Emergomyces africanus TaxID=1955775 RepID=A0A1B7P8W6_9EURO|nr:hypothetical protein ACJ72_00116 [Emergomyces africanus]
MSPRSPYRQPDSLSRSNRTRSPTPTFIQATRQEANDSNPAAFLYKWIKSDRPRLSRPMSSYGGTKAEQIYQETESTQTENKLPLEQTLVHKEFHIEALRGQMRKLISENATECSLLNKKIAGLQAQLSSLQTRVDASENNLEVSAVAVAEREEEVKALRRDFVKKSEAFESHQKEREKEVKELRRALAEKSRALEFRQREKEEEVKELQRGLAEKSDALEAREKKGEQDITELQRTLAQRSRALESHKQEFEQECKQLRQTFATKEEALKRQNQELEEDLVRLRRALVEKSEALEGHTKDREEEVEILRRTFTETSMALQNDKLELEEKVIELQKSLIEAEAREVRELELQREVSALRQAITETSKTLDGQEQGRVEAFAAQKAELEKWFQNLRKEDGRAASELLEEREKMLISQFNEKHTTELENLQSSFATELQHVQDAQAAAIHEFIARLEGMSEKQREGNHLVKSIRLISAKLRRNGSKGTANHKGDKPILALWRDNFPVDRFRPKSSSCEHRRKSDPPRDSGVHCSCACANSVDRV